MIRLDNSTLDTFMSDYLQSGWRQEHMSFNSVDVEPGRIVGMLEVHTFQMPADGRFHLSAQSALAWISQLSIIYGCWENNLPRKMGEVYLRQVELQFNRPVNKTSNIEIRIDFPGRCRRTLQDGSVYYRGAVFEVEKGAFCGAGNFLVPTQAAQCERDGDKPCKSARP